MEKDFLEIANKIYYNIFNRENPYSLKELKEKFAFDIRLPRVVHDSTDNSVTYASSITPTKFITNDNMHKISNEKGWMIPKKEVESLKEILSIWDSINYTTTERTYNCENIYESNPIYNSRNVLCSTDCGEDNFIMYCDGVYKSSYAIACQRSNTINYSIRVDDSNTVTNSYNVICSSKISNSLFIQDCSDLFECIFCSHISNKEYCIANMQFNKEEYYYLKEEIIKWIFS